MRMITCENCWLFPRPCYVSMVTALLSCKVFVKAVKSALQKVNIGNISSLATTNKISVQVFVWQWYVRLPSDRSWQIADLPNLSCGCKGTFWLWGTVLSWTNAFCCLALARECTNFRSDKFPRKDGDQRLQSQHGNHDFSTEAMRLPTIVCEPWGLWQWRCEKIAPAILRWHHWHHDRQVALGCPIVGFVDVLI